MPMKKDDAKAGIEELCYRWAEEKGIPVPSIEQPSFSEFKTWLMAKGYGHYLDFRSMAGPGYDAEHWFDKVFGQTWRN